MCKHTNAFASFQASLVGSKAKPISCEEAAKQGDTLQAVCHGSHHYQEESGAAGKAVHGKLLPTAISSRACPLEDVGDNEGGLYICGAGILFFPL